MHDADSMMSRSGRTDAGGKLTARFDIPVTEELNEAAIAMATLRGVPKAEFLRLVIERAMFGELAMLRRMAGTDVQSHRTNHGGSAE
ncbi:hypothetical protein LJR074_001946 [Acidovorax sp. LjRoot74]|uniref:hypothetical protein n=1 Tax=Acidovorax sp. LjRoot74 TaxID=3342337 RepID=UPI003ECCE25B